MFGDILGLFYNLHVIHFLQKVKSVIYAKILARKFKSIGEKCRIGGFSYLENPKYADIGNHVIIGKAVVLEINDKWEDQTFSPSLHIGNNSSFGDNGHITCINHIYIGNNVRIGRKVFISDNAHGISDFSLLNIAPQKRPLYSKGPVIIEDYCWIGEMVCILPGVKIGKGSIIGANAVVTKDIPPYCVACGNPARIVKYLNDKP